MTTHYIDITVIRDEETSVPHVVGVLCYRLHLAIVSGRR